MPHQNVLRSPLRNLSFGEGKVAPAKNKPFESSLLGQTYMPECTRNLNVSSRATRWPKSTKVAMRKYGMKPLRRLLPGCAMRRSNSLRKLCPGRCLTNNTLSLSYEFWVMLSTWPPMNVRCLRSMQRMPETNLLPCVVT